MRTKSLPTLLLFTALLFFAGTQMFAQKNNTAFAVTGATKGNVAWMTIREIDLTTGSEIRTIYAPSYKPVLLDAVTGSKLQQLDVNDNISNEVTTINRNGIANTMITYANGKHTEVVTAPTETLVAASAYDTRNNRLFFTPMHSNELRYFDLNRGTNEVYYVRNVALKTFREVNGEADVITRMCFGYDGYGYALTNDFNHLIRFSSGDKITITDLGSVQDGKNNKNISIRNMCTSWGGDMVADALGGLYVISMRGNIFKINMQTLVADHIGQAKNIPADYTINGAAVDEAGNVVVGCATKSDHYYSINLTTLEARALPSREQVFNVSDLASSHYVNESAAKAKLPVTVKGNNLVSVYPNPVTNRSINIVFEGLAGNNHNVQLVDVAGHTILTKQVNIYGKTTTQVILPRSVNSGTYIIKVNDGAGKEQYSGKIVVY
ncbi:MAG TPA: T9SS type A sorting domain-containing protein [Chitinophagaceae bacterium]|jgi:hypothetical protein